MKKRQQKKWPWIECAHLSYCGSPTGFPSAVCKRDNKECLQEECRKRFVSKFTKQCWYLGKKAAERWMNGNF